TMRLSTASIRSVSRRRPHSPSAIERSVRRPRIGSFASWKRRIVLTRSALGHTAPAASGHIVANTDAARHRAIVESHHPVTRHPSLVTAFRRRRYNTRFPIPPRHPTLPSNADLRTHDLHERVPPVPGPAADGEADPAVVRRIGRGVDHVHGVLPVRA